MEAVFIKLSSVELHAAQSPLRLPCGRNMLAVMGTIGLLCVHGIPKHIFLPCLLCSHPFLQQPAAACSQKMGSWWQAS